MTPEHFTDLDRELAVGSCPSSPEHITGLAGAGVRAVVNLQTDADLRARALDWNVLWALYARARILPTRVPIVDFEPKDLARGLDDAVAAVHEHVSAGRKVYVHCTAGINRSSSTIIAYLVAHRGLSVRAATAWLAERHSCYPYVDVLDDWAKRHGHLIHGPA